MEIFKFLKLDTITPNFMKLISFLYNIIKKILLIILITIALGSILFVIFDLLSTYFGLESQDEISFGLDLATSVSIVIAVLVYIFSDINERNKDRESELKATKLKTTNKLLEETFDIKKQIKLEIRHISGLIAEIKSHPYGLLSPTNDEELRKYFGAFHEDNRFKFHGEVFRIKKTWELIEDSILFYEHDVLNNPVRKWALNNDVKNTIKITLDGLEQIVNNKETDGKSKLFRLMRQPGKGPEKIYFNTVIKTLESFINYLNECDKLISSADEAVFENFTSIMEQ